MHVTFVCEANQARSPVAAALPAMQDLAAARGLDLSTHRCRGIDEHATTIADLLLTMTREQADLIGAPTNGAVTRCFVLLDPVTSPAFPVSPFRTGSPMSAGSRRAGSA